MKRMIDEGAIGRLQLWRGCWLSDEFVDPQIPFDWRFDRRMGGTTIADLGSHLIDMAIWMVGDIAEVSGQSATFVTERADPEKPGASRPVAIDDASSALVRFATGARGVLENGAQLCAATLRFHRRGKRHPGHPALRLCTSQRASIRRRRRCRGLYGMRRIRAEHPSHPYAASWWPIGQGVGYGSSFVNQFADLLGLGRLGRGIPISVRARRSGRLRRYRAAAAERRWVTVEEIVS
jgi:hypothetical protein